MERVIAIIFLLVIAIGGYSMWWQAYNCTTEFTEKGNKWLKIPNNVLSYVLGFDPPPSYSHVHYGPSIMLQGKTP